MSATVALGGASLALLLGARGVRPLLDRPLAPVLVVVAVIPIGLRPVPGALGLRVMQVAALVAVASIVVRRIGASLTPLALPGPLRWALALLGWALLSVAIAADTARAATQWATAVTAFLLCAAVATSCAGRGRIAAVSLALVVAGTVTTATSLASAGRLQSTAAAGVVSGRATGTFAQPNELGSFAGLLLVVSIGLVAAAAPRGWRGAKGWLLPAVPGACAGVALLLSLSRGAWLGATAGLVLLAVVLPAVRRPLALAVLGAVLLLGGATVVAPGQPLARLVTERVASLGDPSRNPYDDRPALWGEAARQIRAHPLLGVGPDNYGVAALRSGSTVGEVEPAHAHDLPLTVAAEAGLPAVALLVGLTLAMARRGLRTLRRPRDPQERAVVAGLVAGLLGIVVQGAIDVTLRNSLLLLTMALVAGLVLASASASGQPGRRAGGLPR